jgi:ABC-type nitrate/sulfonate/bicarbonate transport system substrate-binding protein
VLVDVARTTGRLAAASVDVVEVPVSSSPAQFAALREGDLDAVLTNPDNVLAYRFLPANPLGAVLDVEIVAAIDRGLALCLGVRPGIGSLEEVAGGTLAVDVATSGFAFVGYALLARAGIKTGDYAVRALGSTPARADALIAGAVDATILNAGNELRARAAGCMLLGDAGDLGPYLGTVVARLRSGAAVHAVDRFVAVLLEVAGELSAGRLVQEALGSARAVLGLDEALAREHLAVLRDPARGLVPSGRVDADSLKTLVALRRAALPDPALDGILRTLDEVVRPGVLS